MVENAPQTVKLRTDLPFPTEWVSHIPENDLQSHNKAQGYCIGTFCIVYALSRELSSCSTVRLSFSNKLLSFYFLLGCRKQWMSWLLVTTLWWLPLRMAQGGGQPLWQLLHPDWGTPGSTSDRNRKLQLDTNNKSWLQSNNNYCVIQWQCSP